jgi:hypothetical protein
MKLSLRDNTKYIHIYIYISVYIYIYTYMEKGYEVSGGLAAAQYS